MICPLFSYLPGEDMINYSTITFIITPKIIIDAVKSMVNLPQTRNDTFNRQWKLAFDTLLEVWCILWKKRIHSK